MNFSEKLIKLRKENLLSQEELGYKLNVTRQTISKWELGQTTPEMGKLVEMSKLFGVTLDELTDDKELEKGNIENNNEEEPNKRNKLIIILLVGALIVLLILGMNKIFKSFSLKEIFGDFFGSQNEIITQAQDFFGDMVQLQQNLLDDANQNQQNLLGDALQAQQNFINQAKQEQQNLIDESGFEQKSFNSSFEIYNGTKYGMHVKLLIDKVVTNNKKEKDKIITTVYQGVSISEPKEIQNLKTNFDDMTQYEVSFEYDEKGYIYQVDIMDLN